MASTPLRRWIRDPDYRRLAEAAIDQGWGWEVRKAHVVLLPPGGGLPISVGTSPRTKGKAALWLRSRLRRRGVDC